MLCRVAQSCPTLCNAMDCSQPGSSVHGDSPGKNVGVGCHALLQRIFPTRESNTGLPHYRWILHCLSHQGSPRILARVAVTFSVRSSWPRNGTRVSSIEGRSFTSWASSYFFLTTLPQEPLYCYRLVFLFQELYVHGIMYYVLFSQASLSQLDYFEIHPFHQVYQ